jgi:hypothetical protein
LYPAVPGSVVHRVEHLADEQLTTAHAGRPATDGPLHEVGGNGTHRTHAMRLLDVPQIAAEVYVPSLPLKLSTADVLTDRSDRPPMADLWQALIDQNLLTGQVYQGPYHTATLEPDHIAAPWLLLAPDDAASLSAAYTRLYPGALAALGVPAAAAASGEAWTRWLLSGQ